MTSKPSPVEAWRGRLSQALRAIRRKRHLSAVEVARRMGMARRSYSHFEAGRGPFNPDHILAFAHATESDPYAILIVAVMEAPALAIRVADNKLASALMILLREFNQDVGEALGLIETSTAISAFSTAFKALADAAALRRDNAAQTWLREELSKLDAADRGPKDD